MNRNNSNHRLNRYVTAFAKFIAISGVSMILYMLSIPLILLLELRSNPMSDSRLAHAYLAPMLAFEDCLVIDQEQSPMQIVDDGKSYVPMHTPALLTHETPSLLVPFESYMSLYGFDVTLAYWAHQLEHRFGATNDGYPSPYYGGNL